MKTAMLFLIIGISISYASNSYSQETFLSVNLRNKRVKEVFREIEKRSEYIFFYYDDVLDVNRKVSIRVNNQTIDKILDLLFEGTKNAYVINDRQIFITRKENVQVMDAGMIAQQQGRQITGTVVDVNGEPVIGANILEKGTTNGIVTDVDGNFSLNVANNAVLQVSFIGYITQEISVLSLSGELLAIKLIEDSQALDEIVVIGYGTQKKVNLSGAVSTVSAKALENRSVTNVNSALQGLAPGMNINLNEGRSNAAPDINIRGYTSINGGSAFILVDNMPVSAAELARINPSDIENVSVLEDAASAAIYGSRAAFGVILITTKLAKSDKMQVSFDANYSIRQTQQLVEPITDPVLFREEVRAVGLTDGWSWGSDAELEYAKKLQAGTVSDRTVVFDGEDSWRYFYESNWFDIIYRETSPTYNTNLNITQKTDKLSYVMSGAFYRQEGILSVGNDALNRYNFRGKADYKFTNWWNVGSNLSFTNYHYDTPSALEGDYYGKLLNCRSHKPIYNPDGTYTSEAGDDVYGLLVDGGRANRKINETMISFNTTIDLFKDVWTVKGDVSFRRENMNYDRANLLTTSREGPNRNLGYRGPDGNITYAHVESGVTNYTVLNLYTDFHKTFARKHYVQALAGFNQEYYYINTFWTRRRNLITESLPTLQLATGEVTNGQTISDYALRGLFFRANYIYDNKYILEFNGRRDGTSRYPKDSRWGFFPSASAAWVVSNEKFFSGVNDALKISYLKFRGSYGVLGNQINNNNYPYLVTMSSGNIDMRLDGSYPMAIYQPGVAAGDLTWEQVRTVNGGIDLGLFDKISASFNIYTRYTEGMLTASKELPAFYGANAPTTNAADLKTKGWDLSVGYMDRTDVGGSPLSFGARFMIWDSRSWITKFDNPTKSLANYYVGQEIGEIWGYHNLGFFASNEEAANYFDQTALISGHPIAAGDLKYANLNGDEKINNGDNTVDNPGDRTIIGNSEARYRYSFDLDGEWKGFDLRVFFHGVGKRDWVIGNNQTFWGNFNGMWTNGVMAQLDRWTEEDPNGYFPRLTRDVNELKLPQTQYLQNASWLRLKNLTVGYTLPESLLKNAKISRLRVYVSGENLWTLNNLYAKWIDPEVIRENFYPMQSVWSMGVNLNF
ncbi:MAG: TonB-dependent receptor [Tannerella sp.]|nr:TonB-dependent receptor [Tannerella sp.]